MKKPPKIDRRTATQLIKAAKPTPRKGTGRGQPSKVDTKRKDFELERCLVDTLDSLVARAKDSLNPTIRKRNHRYFVEQALLIYFEILRAAGENLPGDDDEEND